MNNQRLIDKLDMQVQDLLNNAGEGLLSFQKDLQCEKYFSKECLRIFNLKTIENSNISELLFSDNAKNKELFIEGVQRSLSTNQTEVQELYLSLLPKEQIINNMSIKIDYKILQNKRFIVNLRDITQTKKLEKKLEQQNKIQKMILSIVIDKDDFLELQSEFENFLCHPPLKKKELLRELHTYKGIFAQKNFINIPNAIHLLEATLLQNEDSDTSLKLFFKYNLQKYFYQDLQEITDILGKEYFRNIQTINIRTSEIQKIENLILSILESEKKENTQELVDILNKINMFKYEPLIKLLNHYKNDVRNLAQKLDKHIHPLEIIGDSNLLVSPKFKPFLIFTNSLDHGIENRDERVLRNKDELGTLFLNFEKISNVLIIELGDDGRGIHLEKLGYNAVKKGLITKENYITLNEEEKLFLVFTDVLSTKKSTSITSGRGIGMSTIKSAIEKLGGKISINNNFGKGISFQFTIPLERKLQILNSSQSYHKEIGKAISKQIIKFLHKSLEVDVIKKETVSRLEPSNNFAEINFSGSFFGKCIIFYTDDLKKIMSASLIPDSFSQEDIEAIEEEMPSEITNMVIGLATKKFPKVLQNNLILSPPLNLSKKEVLMIIENSEQKYIKKISTEYGNIFCVILSEEM